MGANRNNRAGHPSYSAAFRVGMGGGSLLVGWILIHGLWTFTFDPAVPLWRLALAVGAVGLFLSGIVILLLGRRLGRRFAAAVLMAGAGAVLVVALAGDGVAWLTSVVGLLTAGIMSFWGATLAGGMTNSGGGHGSP